MIIDVSQPGTCKACGVTVYWRTEKSGRSNPYNAPISCPACDGQGSITIVMLFQDAIEPCEKCDGKGRAQFSHFSSCPAAAEFRNKAK